MTKSRELAASRSLKASAAVMPSWPAPTQRPKRLQTKGMHRPSQKKS